MVFSVEYTDTFNGEANYSWVQRAVFIATNTASNRMLVNRAKEALGISKNFSCEYDDGGTVRYNECNACRCLFITTHRDCDVNNERNRKGAGRMFELDEIKQTIETIATQALNLLEPSDLEQAKYNLKGLQVLINSACNQFNI